MCVTEVTVESESPALGRQNKGIDWMGKTPGAAQLRGEWGKGFTRVRLSFPAAKAEVTGLLRGG